MIKEICELAKICIYDIHKMYPDLKDGERVIIEGKELDDMLIRLGLK